MLAQCRLLLHIPGLFTDMYVIVPDYHAPMLKNLNHMVPHSLKESSAQFFLKIWNVNIFKNDGGDINSRTYLAVSYIQRGVLLLSVLTVHVGLQVKRPVIIAVNVSFVASECGKAVIILYVQYGSMIFVLK